MSRCRPLARPPSPYGRIPSGRAWREILAAYQRGTPTLGTAVVVPADQVQRDACGR